MRLLTTLLLEESVEKYSPDQPRDSAGRWGEGGSETVAASKASAATKGKGNTFKNHMAASQAHNKAGSAHLMAAVRAGATTAAGKAHLAQSDKHFAAEKDHRKAANTSPSKDTSNSKQSKAAWAATATAERSNSSADHVHAALLHERAATSAMKSNDFLNTTRHEQQARMHDTSTYLAMRRGK